jgi:hypothetical protein
MAPAPADWAEFAPTLGVNAARRRWGRNHKVLARWEAETGISLIHGEKAVKRPAPDDFAARHAEMSIVKLAKHYQASPTAVMRWVQETGIGRAAGVKIAHAVQFAKSKASFGTIVSAGSRTGAIDRPRRDVSRAGQAADYLRHFGPVVRCDERGRYAENGTYWRRGSIVLTAEEVIERAERNGWQPDAWKLVA